MVLSWKGFFLAGFIQIVSRIYLIICSRYLNQNFICFHILYLQFIDYQSYLLSFFLRNLNMHRQVHHIAFLNFSFFFNLEFKVFKFNEELYANQFQMIITIQLHLKYI